MVFDLGNVAKRDGAHRRAGVGTNTDRRLGDGSGILLFVIHLQQRRQIPNPDLTRRNAHAVLAKARNDDICREPVMRQPLMSSRNGFEL